VVYQYEYPRWFCHLSIQQHINILTIESADQAFQV